MTTKIFFVRHGEVKNPNKIWYGRLPGFDLSQQGKKQILQTAQFLSKNKINAIYSSPLLRTKNSAEIIGSVLNSPINYSDYLLEVNSSLRGKTFSYISDHFAKLNVFASRKYNIRGETIEDIAIRMQKFVDLIIKNHKGQNIVAVTHGDPIMIIKTQITGLPLKIDSIRPTKSYIKQGEVYLAEYKTNQKTNIKSLFKPQ